MATGDFVDINIGDIIDILKDITTTKTSKVYATKNFPQAVEKILEGMKPKDITDLPQTVSVDKDRAKSFSAYFDLFKIVTRELRASKTLVSLVDSFTGSGGSSIKDLKNPASVVPLGFLLLIMKLIVDFMMVVRGNTSTEKTLAGCQDLMETLRKLLKVTERLATPQIEVFQKAVVDHDNIRKRVAYFLAPLSSLFLKQFKAMK